MVGVWVIPFSDKSDMRLTLCVVVALCGVLWRSQEACSAGKYNNLTSQDEVGDCVSCPPGWYCPSASAVPLACGWAGVFCPFESESPRDVTVGYYTLPDTDPEEHRWNETVCEAGSWCDGGVKSPCLAGRYSTDVGRPAECVELCSPGTWCDSGSTEEVSCWS